MTAAFCWEVSLASGPADACRVLVADRWLAVQPLERGNGRPRWIIEETTDHSTAQARALAVTGQLEKAHGGTLAVAPVQIALRHAEIAALRRGEIIPVPLRVRCYTALWRARQSPIARGGQWA